MPPLTKKQQEILSYVEQFHSAQGYAPTYREIAHHFNFQSVSSAFKIILQLKRKGYLIGSKEARSLMPSKKEEAISTATHLPFIGTLRIGHPIETFAQIKMVPVPQSMINLPHKSYVLQLKGANLETDQMCPGDLLIVEARSELSPGEIAVVIINTHETWIKRIYQEDGFIRLEPLSSNSRSIVIRSENIAIQGAVSGLLRYFSTG